MKTTHSLAVRVSENISSPAPAFFILVLISILPALPLLDSPVLVPWFEETSSLPSLVFSLAAEPFGTYRALFLKCLLVLSSYFLVLRLTQSSILSLSVSIVYSLLPSMTECVAVNENITILAGTTALFGVFISFTYKKIFHRILAIAILLFTAPTFAPMLILWRVIQKWPLQFRVQVKYKKHILAAWCVAGLASIAIGILITTSKLPEWMVYSPKTLQDLVMFSLSSYWDAFIGAFSLQSEVLKAPGVSYLKTLLGTCLVAAAIYLRRAQHPYRRLEFAVVWFTVAYFIQWSIIPSSWYNPERLRLIASFGVIFAAFSGAAYLSTALKRTKLSVLVYPETLMMSFFIAMVLGSVVSSNQHASWKSPQILFEKASRQTPASASALYAAGKLSIERGKIVNAIEMFRQALRVDALRYEFLQVEIGKLSLAQRNYDDAAEWLELAKFATPDDADISYYLGKAYMNLNQDKKALVEFKRAAELSTFQSESLIELVRVSLRTYDFPSANMYLNASIAKVGQTLENTLWTGVYYTKTQQYTAAIQIFESLLTHTKDSSEFLESLMVAYLYTEKDANAKKILEYLKVSDPTNDHAENEYKLALQNRRVTIKTGPALLKD